MRVAYPVAQEGYSGKVKALKGPYMENFAFLREHGYSAVELLVTDPDTVDTGRLADALGTNGLELAAIGTSPMQISEKLFLLHADSANRAEARRRCSSLIRLCSKFHVPALMGKYRGMISDEPGCSEHDLLSVLKDVCSEAGENGVRVLIEPQNATNINNINTIGDGLEWCARLGDAAGLLADVYHMGITEKSIAESMRMAADRIGFIHMSDSGRMVPGKGTLPIKEVVRAIAQMGYTGYVSLEIDQVPDGFTAAAEAAEFLLSL